MTSPIYNQNGFRFYEDAGNGGPSWTPLELENADRTEPAGTSLRIRFEVEVTNSKAASNIVFYLMMQKNGTGGYQEVNLSSTDGINITASPYYADGDTDANDRLTSSSLTFVNAALEEGSPLGNNVVGGVDFSGTDHWEIEVCITINDTYSDPDDYYDLQIWLDTSTALDGYTRTPRITHATGDVTVVMSTVTLAGTARSTSVIPGAVIALMEEVTLISGPQAMSVSAPPPPVTIPVA